MSISIETEMSPSRTSSIKRLQRTFSVTANQLASATFGRIRLRRGQGNIFDFTPKERVNMMDKVNAERRKSVYRHVKRCRAECSEGINYLTVLSSGFRYTMSMSETAEMSNGATIVVYKL